MQQSKSEVTFARDMSDYAPLAKLPLHRYLRDMRPARKPAFQHMTVNQIQKRSFISVQRRARVLV